ncbi:MAG: hypothetical protein HC837_05070 [Chloroflexaceae bacterium]|nr:hypothetical protein [Chloroflexaceae bacterium]
MRNGQPLLTTTIQNYAITLTREGTLMLKGSEPGSELVISPEMLPVLYQFFTRIDVAAWLPYLDEDEDYDD